MRVVLVERVHVVVYLLAYLLFGSLWLECQEVDKGAVGRPGKPGHRGGVVSYLFGLAAGAPHDVDLGQVTAPADESDPLAVG